MNQYKKYRKPDLNRKSEASSVGDVLQEMINSYKLNRKFDEAQVVTLWEKVLGKPIADRTTNLYMKNQKLFVTLNSSVLKQELNMSKLKIIQLFEEEVGKPVIKDIIFL
jgi:predicted nucleic acid-binding Zn ribbon protein